MADTTTYRPVAERTIQSEETTYLPSLLKRTSWGAMVAGAVVAISAQMLLTVLGIALGATVTDLNGGGDPEKAGMAAAVWWIVTGTLSLFLGGCVVGRFGGMVRSPDVLLHGLTMWGVTALFGFLAVTTGAGALYGSSMNAVYSPDADHPAPSWLNRTGERAATPGTEAAQGEEDVSPEEARRYTAQASWWTLGGLLLGIGASLAGSWLCAPNRIVLRPPSEVRAL